MKKKLVVAIMFATLSMNLIGCSSTEAESENNVVINDQNDTEEVQEEQEIQEEQRIIASSVAVVEILDALDLDMVGVPTSEYDLPERVADVTRIGAAMTPDVEVVKSLDPTMLISVDSLSEDLKQSFDNLNIPYTFVDLSSYDGLKESIQVLGDMFDRTSEAQEIIADFEQREGVIEERIEGQESPSVLVMFGAPGSFMVATDNSYVGDLVNRVGAENIIKEQQGSFIPVDMEYLADQNPDYILTMTHASTEAAQAMFEEEFATNPAWNHFDATKEDRVYALPTSYFGMSANLLAIDAMEMLTEMLYD